MQKLLCLFLSAAALVSAQGLPSPNLSLVAPVSVPPGAVANVTVALSTPTGATAPVDLDFSLVFSADVTKATVTLGSAASAAGKTFTCTTFAVGQPLRCIIAGLNTNSIGNGPVLAFALTLSSTVAGGTSEQLVLAPSPVAAVDASSAAIALTTSPGSFSIVSISPCDLNKDGKVDSLDVTAVALQVIGVQQCTTGDLTQDAKCDLMDVYREVLAAIPTSSAIPGSGVCKVGP